MKASKVVLTMNKTQRITLYDLLDEVEEPRRGNAIKHNLKDIIFIVQSVMPMILPVCKFLEKPIKSFLNNF